MTRVQICIELDEDDAKEVLKHVHHLWRFDVHLESMQDEKVARNSQARATSKIG